MLIDGRALAERVYAAVKAAAEACSVPPHVTIVTCAPNSATQQYLALKKRRASAVGVAVNVIELPASITTEEAVAVVVRAQMQTNAIVVQLPLPEQLDTATILNAIPCRYDADGMHYDGTPATTMSPVVGAIETICQEHDLLLAAQQVVVVGDGRLVGQPAVLWAQRHGAHVATITKETNSDEARAVVAHADVLILGAGQAHLVQPDMVKPGVIIFDAGTSEDGGELKGDADPACAEKASLMTPVPGGIGPLTVACLLRNVVDLSSRQGCAS